MPGFGHGFDIFSLLEQGGFLQPGGFPQPDSYPERPVSGGPSNLGTYGNDFIPKKVNLDSLRAELSEAYGTSEFISKLARNLVKKISKFSTYMREGDVHAN